MDREQLLLKYNVANTAIIFTEQLTIRKVKEKNDLHTNVTHTLTHTLRSE